MQNTTNTPAALQGPPRGDPFTGAPPGHYLTSIEERLQFISEQMTAVLLGAMMVERSVMDGSMSVPLYRIREACAKANEGFVGALRYVEQLGDMGLDVLHEEAMAEVDAVASAPAEKPRTPMPTAHESVSAKIVSGMVAEARAHTGYLSHSIRQVLGAGSSTEKCQVFDSLVALHGVLQDLADEVGLDHEKFNWGRYCPDGTSAETPAPATNGQVQS